MLNLFYPGLFPWPLEFLWFPHCDWVSRGYLHEPTPGEPAVFRVCWNSIFVQPGNMISVSFFRLFRVLRVVKLLSKGDGLRTLLYTFVKSFQALPWVAAFIAIIFFVYGVVGMQVRNIFHWFNSWPFFLFRSLGKLSQERALLSTSTTISRLSARWGQQSYATRWFWFRHFSSSFARRPGKVGKRSCLPVLPHRSLTASSYITLTLIQAAVCDPNSDQGDATGCGSNFSFFFFTSFILICGFLVLNLFIAVIMDNFDYLVQDRSILGPHHLVSIIFLK